MAYRELPVSDALASDGALGCSDPTRRRCFVNPQAAFAYDLEGVDSHQLTMPPAPAVGCSRGCRNG
jgi:hypothetical protein